jgi:hypothetical protein
VTVPMITVPGQAGVCKEHDSRRSPNARRDVVAFLLLVYGDRTMRRAAENTSMAHVEQHAQRTVSRPAPVLTPDVAAHATVERQPEGAL